MASEGPRDYPRSIKQEPEESSAELEQTLSSTESLDRSSPEIWPEACPRVRNVTPPSAIEVPYSREMGMEDQSYMRQLSTLSVAELVLKVKELHDVAYQLGVEEAKEVSRAKHLNIFQSRKERRGN